VLAGGLAGKLDAEGKLACASVAPSCHSPCSFVSLAVVKSYNISM
jgi:hypothetical protein